MALICRQRVKNSGRGHIGVDSGIGNEVNMFLDTLVVDDPLCEVLRAQFVPLQVETWDDLVGVVIDLLQARDRFVRVSEWLIGEALYLYLAQGQGGLTQAHRATKPHDYESVRQVCAQLSESLGGEPAANTLYKWWRAVEVQRQLQESSPEFVLIESIAASTVYEVGALTPDSGEQRQILEALGEGEITLREVRELITARQRYPGAGISPVQPVRFLYDARGRWWSLCEARLERINPGTWQFSVMIRRLRGEPLTNAQQLSPQLLPDKRMEG